ncbi:hypothetical protein G6F36_012017 [Rhizopus arrhizus]|nr:hypothetical protein G6F36_012017 [Rhizopus arrhizus]
MASLGPLDFHRILNGIPKGIFQLALSSRITSANPRWVHTRNKRRGIRERARRLVHPPNMFGTCPIRLIDRLTHRAFQKGPLFFHRFLFPGDPLEVERTHLILRSIGPFEFNPLPFHRLQAPLLFHHRASLQQRQPDRFRQCLLLSTSFQTGMTSRPSAPD